MTHHISPSLTFVSFYRYSFSALRVTGWREQRRRRNRDLFEISRSCRQCANSHMQTLRELAASIKINTGSVVGAKIKRDQFLLALASMRRRTREFWREIFCLPLFLLLSSTLMLSHDHQCDFYEIASQFGIRWIRENIDTISRSVRISSVVSEDLYTTASSMIGFGEERGKHRWTL